jgi:hypothetical protein
MKSAPAARKTSRIPIALVLALTGLSSIAVQSCSQPAPQAPAAEQTAAPFTVTPIDSPAGPGSSEPNLTVQGERLFLSWLEDDEGHSTLRFAERTATGWTPAQSIRSSDQINVNAEDIPSVQILANGTLAAAWTDKNGPNPEASTLRLSFSTDQGKTWSAPASPYRDSSETQHGFVSLFQAPGAGLGLVWLDGRALAGKEEGQGDMALRWATYDPAGKQLKEAVIDPRACECCSTSAAATSDGILVAYRDRSADEIRDIYVTTFDGTAWSAPVLVHADNWMINGCPVNGPAVSARGREVAVAWFTAKDDQGQAFVAFSHDAGKTFGPAVRLDEGRSLGHVGVQLLADGSAAVSNIELVDFGAQFRARKVTAAGARSAIVNVAGDGDPDTRSPRLAGNGRELLFAWTESDENDVEHVHVARAALAAN